MAFQHFHRHSRKYMWFSAVAIVFSLFTFNITSALHDFFGAGRRAAAKSFVTFQTVSGQKVEIGEQEWYEMYTEVLGFASLPILGSRFYQPNAASDAPIMHAILLQEARALGIVIPEDYYVREYDGFIDLIMMISRSEQPLTVGAFHGYLGQFRLSPSGFERRFKEALAIEVYRELIDGSENQVPDPEGVFRIFAAEVERVALDYVEFPFQRFKDELKASPPSDEELQKYMDGLAAAEVNTKFSYPERATFNIASIHADNVDFSALPAEALGKYTEPTPDDLLAAYGRDFIRYGKMDPAPTSGDQLSAETRDKIVRDLKVRAILSAARATFDAEVETIEEAAKAASEPPPKEGQEAPKPPEATPEQKAEKAEKLRAAFEAVAVRFGLAYARHEDATRDSAPSLDPPGDRSLWFLQMGLAEGSGVQAVEPARDRATGYLMHLDRRKPVERKAFADLREALLDHWVEGQASKVAEETARKFRDEIRAAAISGRAPDLLDELNADKDRELAKIDADKKRDEKTRERLKKDTENSFFDRAAAFLGPGEAALFEAKAAEQKLEIKHLPLFRRDIKETPYFDQRFKGAEKFLMEQNGYSTESSPHLLGAAPGFVSNVMVDEEGAAVYVALVKERKRPELGEMTVKDRLEAQNLWLQRERERQLIPFSNLFSIYNMRKRHDPKVLVREEPKEASEPALPPY